MKKYFILIMIILFVAGCNEKKARTKSDFNELVSEFETKKKVDSMVKNSIRDAVLKDTANFEASPVKILAARPVKQEYSNYKDVSITYKNVSGKVISAIRFKWYGVNAFNEAADMGILDGVGSGFTDDRLGIGKSRTSEWSILSKDLKKIVKAWAYEVAFVDGTKWEGASSY